MNLQEIKEKAQAFGLQGIGKMRKAELVRGIQQAEGNTACYGADWRNSCGELDCCWRADCLKEKSL
jgi:hypothetical protein